MKIKYTLAESEKGNPVVKFTIEDQSYIEPRILWGDTGFKEIQKLSNFISDTEMANIKQGLKTCRELYKKKFT